MIVESARRLFGSMEGPWCLVLGSWSVSGRWCLASPSGSNPLAFKRRLQEACDTLAAMREYRRAAHTVYCLHYHFVFITKYRKPVLPGDVGGEVRDLVREVCRTLDVEILEGHIRPEHVHLLLSVPPHLAPSRVMQGRL